MVLTRDRLPVIVPRSCGGRMSCIFLVLVPMFAALALAGLWMFKTKQTWELVEEKVNFIEEHTLRIGRLIMDFNTERELTAAYTTARALESQLTSKEDLDRARHNTDISIMQLNTWPGVEQDGHMYRSRYLFHAVLARHRELVKVGNYYQDEILFYTDIIDVVWGWLTRDVEMYGDTAAWRWLLAYTYLLGSLNYLGAEQALCSVFFSMVCFSHRETFYYTNYSYGGEATFRLYRQSYPEERGGGWHNAAHSKFFPTLYACREEIVADLSYQGMSMDPSMCDEGRKNETRFHDTDILTLHEHQRLVEAILGVLRAEADHHAFAFMLSGVVLGVFATYYTVLHILRCAFIKCIQLRRAPPWDPKDGVLEEDKLDGLTLESKMIKYEEYNHHTTDNMHVKVATV